MIGKDKHRNKHFLDSQQFLFGYIVLGATHSRGRTNILPLGSLFFVIFCTMRYGWGFKNFLNEVNQGQGFALPYWVKFYMAWVLPIIIMVILIIGYLDVFDIWHL